MGCSGLSSRVSFIFVVNLFKPLLYSVYLGIVPKICLAVPVILGVYMGCVLFKLVI